MTRIVCNSRTTRVALRMALGTLLAAALCIGALPGENLLIDTADAAMCAKCRDLMFVDSAGTCSVCGAPTNSGAMRLCPKCSERLHQCEHCGQPIEATPQATVGAVGNELVAPQRLPTTVDNAPAQLPPAIASSALPLSTQSLAQAPLPSLPQPIAPLPSAPPAASPALPYRASASIPPGPIAQQPGPINPQRAGLYLSGQWRYQLQINNPGISSESRWGVLSYNDQKLPHGDVNDYYRTPWGPIYWVDVPKNPVGLHGWMPIPLVQSARPGRALAIPASFLALHATTQPTSSPALAYTAAPARPQTLELNRSHNGQVAHVHVGNMIVVRLPGNPATGYQWQAVASRTTNMPLAGRPQFVAASQTNAPGTFVFVFQPTQPGAGTIRIHYVRTGDTTKPPAEVYGVNVDVQDSAPRSNP